MDQVNFISGMQRWFNIILYHIRRTKKHTFMLVDVKDTFKKIQHHFMIKKKKPHSKRVGIKDIHCDHGTTQLVSYSMMEEGMLLPSNGNKERKLSPPLVSTALEF